MSAAEPMRLPAPRSSGLLHVGRYWLLIALVAMTAVFVAFRPEMLEPGNVATILRSFSLMALMILGLTWIIAAGKIDVSFMQVAALGNMTAAGLLAHGESWLVAGAAGVVAGLLIGLVNGLLIGYLRISPLISTISTGGICASAAAAIGHGTSIRINDPGLPGKVLAAGIGPIPVIFICAVALYAVSWWMQERLTFGHYVYATAQNEEAVIEVGVRTNRLILLLYVISGFCSALTGVLLVASLSSGQPMIGTSYFIDGLTAAFLGGMMIRLSQPNVIGTATAILLLTVLVSGSALLGWPDYERQIIKGVLLLGGVIVAVRLKRADTLSRMG